MADPDLYVTETVPHSDRVTPYDQQHFVTYARLLDAEQAAADWREAAQLILLIDPEKDPEGARRCWQSHLERARWMRTTGYQQLLAESQHASGRISLQ